MLNGLSKIMIGLKNKNYFFFMAAVTALFCGCENTLWNDFAAQGKWEKAGKVLYVDKVMQMEIDNSRIRWKEKGAADWEEDLHCSASFGVLYIQFPDKTVKGNYLSILNYLVLSGFTWDDRLDWLNGGWTK
jgi:hypothetical protein